MLGAEFVEVSAHVAARPTHAIWQGGVYSLKGNKDGYKDFRATTGYGTGEGLGGLELQAQLSRFLSLIQ
jgi:hypothetical protein